MLRAGMGEQFSALGAEKEEGGHVVGAREGGGRTCCRSYEAVTGKLEGDNLQLKSQTVKSLRDLNP